MKIKKYFLKIFAGILCLALLLTACGGPTVTPEDSPRSESSDSSSPESIPKEETGPISYPEWAETLVWQLNVQDPDGNMYKIGPFYVGDHVPLGITFGGENTIFCIAVRAQDIEIMKRLQIPYYPVSESDLIEWYDENPNDFVRAYVNLEQIRTLITSDVFVSFTVPERPKGYPEKVADGLAFLLETTDWEEYPIIYYTNNCPRDMAQGGRATFLEPEDPNNDYNWEYGWDMDNWEELQTKWYSEENLTREEIIELAKNPEIRSIFHRTSFHTCITDLEHGKLTKKTEVLNWKYRDDLKSREEYLSDLEEKHNMYEYFGVKIDEDELEREQEYLRYMEEYVWNNESLPEPDNSLEEGSSEPYED